MLKIIPLGGLGEIGLNMMVFEYRGTLFIVDCGLMFPEDYMLGVDFVIPDMDYIRTNREKVAAIVLTHAHEDHIGALPFLLRIVNAPVFGTPFTLGVVRNKLEEFGLAQSAHGANALHAINLLQHMMRRNSRKGSRHNIAAHYDLGNEFYALFLDDTLTYSCGYFETDSSSLRDASLAKYDRICKKQPQE